MALTQLRLLLLLTLLAAHSCEIHIDAAPAGPLIKHLATLLKWSSRSSSKASQPVPNVLQFEDGYLTETVAEGNVMGMVPYKIRVSADGELYAVDEVNSNIVKISPPLSQYSRGRFVAGSFQGQIGHVDGKPAEARFNHPKGVTMDDKGNVYVADTLNLAIRKISDKEVTTIAGGKSNVAGYRDGPSEDAQFSNDFDVIYSPSTCSLLVIDRGNAALRQILLTHEDCDHQAKTISRSVDALTVVGAVFGGYLLCVLHFGFSSSQKLVEPKGELDEPVRTETQKEEPKWPSLSQLLADLWTLSVEGVISVVLCFVPSWGRPNEPKGSLTPLKDSLRMPEDEEEQSPMKAATPLPQKLSENSDEEGLVNEKKLTASQMVHRSAAGKERLHDDVESPMRPPKARSSAPKEGSLLAKHRSSKRQELADFYGTVETNTVGRSKSHKEKSRHRHKSMDFSYKPSNLFDAKNEREREREHLRVRNKYESENSYRYA